MELQDWTGISYDDAKSVLKKWRDDHSRRSEEIVEIWEHVLSRYGSALKDELWTVLEQVTIAALDSARHDLAIECLQRLNKKFPQSSRLTKLQAMRLESLGNFDDALYLYNKLIESDESNSIFRKRKIAIFIALGDRQGAINELNQYLEIFVNDTEAWLQLSELFLQESDYARAAFCFEELLLTNPNNATYLCRIADIRYSQGGFDNIEIAKVYYEKSISLSPSANAYYGLILCCSQLSTKTTALRKKEIIGCGVTACDNLINLYESQQQNFEQQAENPTIERQVRVILLLKSQLKD